MAQFGKSRAEPDVKMYTTTSKFENVLGNRIMEYQSVPINQSIKVMETKRNNKAGPTAPQLVRGKYHPRRKVKPSKHLIGEKGLRAPLIGGNGIRETVRAFDWTRRHYLSL